MIGRSPSLSDTTAALYPGGEPLWHRLALPTWGLYALCYGGWGLVTWSYHALPWWLVAPLGGYLVCLHGSLQHEAVHGRPTGNRVLEALLVFPSLWLWLPFTHYRETHIRHHRNAYLTNPLEDPESNYVTAEQWARMGPLERAVRRSLRTLAGRLILVPPLAVWQVVATDLPLALKGDRRVLGHWLPQIPSVALVLWWVMGVCGIPFWEYVLLFAYPGLSLTVLRSFAEHRPAEAAEERSAIVEAGLLMRLLFVGNNYHAIHHEDPRIPWYDWGAIWDRDRARVLAANGGYVFAGGYLEIARRYLFSVRDGPVHPYPEKMVP